MSKTMENYNRVYVRVLALFYEDGRVLPRMLLWKDGRKYRIDRVTRIQPAAARKAGGQGDRYTVMINGQERYLFYERTTDLAAHPFGSWFVEAPAIE